MMLLLLRLDASQKKAKEKKTSAGTSAAPKSKTVSDFDADFCPLYKLNHIELMNSV